jgi:hypothetical protein
MDHDFRPDLLLLGLLALLALLIPLLAPGLSLNAFWRLFIILCPLLSFYPLSPTVIICWVYTTVICHDKIWVYMPFDRWIFWIAVFNTISLALNRSRPIQWHPLGVAILAFTGFTIRPDLSIVRLVLWELCFCATLIPLYIWFLHIWLFPEVYLYPYNRFSKEWKLGSARWYPVNRRADLQSNLCQSCNCFTASSNLIMGPKRPSMVRLLERHELNISFEDLRYQATRSGLRCQLCRLLWHSISGQRRKVIIWGRRWLWIHSFRKVRQAFFSQTNGAFSTASCDPAAFWTHSKSESVPLAVKIWEERPITRYTFVQLFSGDSAIGSRLLIHRGEISARGWGFCHS